MGKSGAAPLSEREMLSPSRHVARRRSELSAIRMPTMLLLTWALLAPICGTPWCSAAPATGSAKTTVPRDQPSSQRPLTREDVEMLLQEARSAIQQGQLEEADSLLSRAENARIYYPLLHFGPTPASVRREWNRAQKAQRPVKNELPRDDSVGDKRSQPPAAGDHPSGGARGTADETIDPFLAQSRGVAEGRARLSAPGDRPLPLQREAGAREFGDAATVDPQRLPALSAPINNPFARQGGLASARYDAAAASHKPVSQASWEDKPATMTNNPAAAGADASLQSLEDDDASFALPDAPLPPGTATQRPAGSSFGLSPPRRTPAAQTPAASEASGTQTKQQALAHMSEARLALEAGNVDLAEELSRAANALGVPESQFLPDEDRPSLVAWDIVRAKQTKAAPPPLPSRGPALPARETDAASPPRVAALAQLAEEDLPLPEKPPIATGPPTISDTPEDAPGPESAQAPSPLIDAADKKQQALARQLSAEVGKRQTEAHRLRSEDPERALAILREAQQLVNDSALPESSRRELLSRIEITLNKTQTYIKDHAAEIELDQQNAAALKARDRDREVERKVEQKVAESVDEFNRLRDEHRYAEAEIVAKRLYELAPEHPMAIQVLQMAKFIRREVMNRELTNLREDANWNQFNDVERSSFANVGDGHELEFDHKRWRDFVTKRKGTKDRIQRRSERELEIERRLKTPVMLRYEDTPLSEVVNGLSELAGVNIHLDPRGLTQEGINSDTTVTLNLNKEIALASALNLILAPLHLSYVIKDDVLMITSEQLRDGEIFAVTYNVSDLVIPIPNFVPNNNIGLQGLINDSLSAAGYAQGGVGGAGPTVLVSGREGQNASGANDQVLAQQFNAGPATGMSPGTVPVGVGPGGMGGGALADFDSLIDLIVSTVSTETWAENGGGEAEIRPFPTNLSLVISQTQAVHEEIADLLEQLRRLQDLQVTIEVRFIRLTDDFFERIGIDFQLNVEDKILSTDDITHEFDANGVIVREPPGSRSATVGALRQVTGSLPNFTSDLDIPFRQDSFGLTQLVPFGGPVQGGLNFGFAILSDIEAYFLIEAAHADRRTNVLNAPKVTLFNGQQAFVGDLTQRPFVVGVIPVVGEFAAAQQPVIVVLNEGTMMTIQAVVSDDRRYVRMTIVPFFTQIGDVDEFTFEGSTTTTDSSSSKDDDDDGKNEEESDSETSVRSGVTVQLPSFSFVSVVTTVSVPDGGTVLMGGIKRLSEGRNEFGVPLLSKLPYINRLFRNVSIGRETDSLMMMVTPRIIIQEEEEERLGIAVP